LVSEVSRGSRQILIIGAKTGLYTQLDSIFEKSRSKKESKRRIKMKRYHSNLTVILILGLVILVSLTGCDTNGVESLDHSAKEPFEYEVIVENQSIPGFRNFQRLLKLNQRSTTCVYPESCCHKG